MMIGTNYPANSENYTKGRRGKILYIVLHYTGNDGDRARSNARYFSENRVGASAHFFVDEEELYQSVPLEDTAWHCGAKRYRHPHCRNENSIGIELCAKKKNGYFVFSERTLQSARDLTRALMAQYQIPTECVLRHYDVTGKLCPEPMVREESLWTAWKKELEEDSMKTEELEQRITALEAGGRYRYIDENLPDWAEETVKKLCRRGILKGDSEAGLDLSRDMLRILVLHDRMGLYEEVQKG